MADSGAYPHVLLAVDPALLKPGAALFVAGELRGAARIKVPRKLAELDMGPRCAEVGKLICEWYWETLIVNLPRPDHVYPSTIVFEWPKVYDPREARRQGRRHVDPRDLIPLAGVGMYVVGQLGAGAEIISREPAQWIGQVPKATTGDPLASPRGAKLWPLLSAAEQDRVRDGLTHDALDAIGLGLHGLRRLPPPGSMRGRVLPGAT